MIDYFDLIIVVLAPFLLLLIIAVCQEVASLVRRRIGLVMDHTLYLILLLYFLVIFLEKLVKLQLPIELDHRVKFLFAILPSHFVLDKLEAL